MMLYTTNAHPVSIVDIRRMALQSPPDFSSSDPMGISGPESGTTAVGLLLAGIPACRARFCKLSTWF